MTSHVLLFAPPLWIGWQRMFAGFRRYARERGWVPHVYHENDGPTDVKGLIGLWKPVGCICSAKMRKSLPRTMPVALFDGADRFLPSLEHEADSTVRMAADELMRFPRRDLFALGHPGDPGWSRTRVDGFAEIVRSKGCSCRIFKPTSARDNQCALQRELRDWVKTLPHPCGIFAVNDYVGNQLMNALAAVGLAVPQEVAVVGVDDNEALCESVVPTLSSVLPDWDRGGYLLGGLLDDAIAGRRNVATFGAIGIVRRASTRISLTKDDPRIVRAVEYVRTHAVEGLRVTDVAKFIGCSRRLAELRFRELTGHSILETIHTAQLDCALALLRGRATPVGVIADSCGFRSAHAFREYFRKAMGMSMSEWLAQN